MTSYLVYVVARMRNYPGLSPTRSIISSQIYEFYPHLTMKEGAKKFRRVNNAFFAIFFTSLTRNCTTEEFLMMPRKESGNGEVFICNSQNSHISGCPDSQVLLTSNLGAP